MIDEKWEKFRFVITTAITIFCTALFSKAVFSYLAMMRPNGGIGSEYLAIGAVAVLVWDCTSYIFDLLEPDEEDEA